MAYVLNITSVTQLLVAEGPATIGDVKVVFDLVTGGTYGYIGGGGTTINHAAVATTDRILYSTGVASVQGSAALSQARAALGGINSSGAWGYWAGGGTAQSPDTPVTTADKITFANDTTIAKTTANLQAGGRLVYGSSVSEEVTKGYWCGGNLNQWWGASLTNVADMVTFSTDATVAKTSANLGVNRRGAGGVYGVTKGYLGGGYTASAYVTTVEKITFSSDVTSSATNLSLARAFLVGMSERGTKGYFLGGFTPNLTVGTAERITFATDTMATVGSAALSQARDGAGAVSPGGTVGYIAGGATGNDAGVVNTGDQLTFSSETTAAWTSANLSSARAESAGVSAI